MRENVAKPLGGFGYAGHPAAWYDCYVNITTANVIAYKGTPIEITYIDTFEGYKEDLVLYCKVKS